MDNYANGGLIHSAEITVAMPSNLNRIRNKAFRRVACNILPEYMRKERLRRIDNPPLAKLARKRRK